MSEILQLSGAYALPLNPESKLLLFPVPQEDLRKKEATTLSRGMRPITAGMLGILSGCIDNGCPVGTLVAEAEEERQLVIHPSWLSNGLPTLTVGQFRPDKGDVSFRVSGYVLRLPDHKVTELLTKTPIAMVDYEALPRFLNDHEKDLRPLVYAVAWSLLQSGDTYRL